jgi:hypothetical protein
MLTVKILFLTPISKNYWATRQGFLVFQLPMYSKNTHLTLEKILKNKLCLWGYFCTFTQIFCVINKVMGDTLVFSHLLLNF